MNENPEGTPNPLNPNPQAGPIEQPPVPENQPSEDELEQPTESVEQPLPAEESIGQPSEPEQPKDEKTEEPEQVAEEPVVAGAIETVEEIVTQTTTTEPKFENAPKEPKKKSNKTGLILALVFLLVAVITGIVAALIVFNPFAKADDAVPAAISKLISGNLPNNVAMDGKITVNSSDPNSSFSYLEVDFGGGVSNQTTESYASAKVTATLVDGSNFSFDADEVHTSGGDLYLKLSNIYSELNKYYDYSDQILDTTDVVTAPIAPGESLLDYLGVFEVIDDEWIRIPETDFSNVSDLAQIDAPTQCLIDAAGKLGQYGGNLASIYKQYPFINYSTSEPVIAKKANSLYRLTIDADKFTGFINSMGNSGFANEMLACAGRGATNIDITSSEISNIIDFLPTIYVEIDGDNNFTRVYLSVLSVDRLTDAVADIALSYPSGIVIDEPTEYINLNQALLTLMNEFYGQPIVSEETIITD